MNSDKKRKFAWILCLCILFANVPVTTVGAADETGAATWGLSIEQLTHTAISFKLSSVEKAQDATLIVESTNSDAQAADAEKVSFEIPFSILKPEDDITLDIPDGKYLPQSISYNIYIRDSEGNETNKVTRYVSCNKPTFYARRKCIYIYNKGIYGVGNTLKHVKVTTGFTELKEYETDVEAGAEKIALYYDEQELGTLVKVEWSDDYGCSGEEQLKVADEDTYYYNQAMYELWLYSDRRAYKDCLVIPAPSKDRRIGVEVEGKVYYSEYGSSGPVLIKYPQVSDETTKIKVWLEGRCGTKSSGETFPIEDCHLDNCVGSCTANASTVTGMVDNSKIIYSDITKVKTVIDGKEYSCDIDANNSYTLTYPERENGDKLTLIYMDKHGCTYEKVVTVKVEIKETPTPAPIYPPDNAGGYSDSTSSEDYEGDYEPSLELYTIHSSDTKIKGITEKNSSITIKVGKNTYTGKSNGNGTFSIKIKPAGTYTGVKVSVVTPKGKTASLKDEIQPDYGEITIKSKPVYKNKTKVKVKIGYLKKGDTMVLQVGKKTYDKKAKHGVETFRIKKARAGEKIKASLYDKYDYEKDTDSDMVYSAKTIKKGMSAKDAIYTEKWGKPVRRNSYNSWEQWIYRKGKTSLYVYITKGKVKSINKYNY